MGKMLLLPCSGLDKSLGSVSRRAAILAQKDNEALEIICPVLLNTGDPEYQEKLKLCPVIVIDGCMNRCAAKLAAAKGAKIAEKYFIPDLIKKYQIFPEKDLIPGEKAQELAQKIAQTIIAGTQKSSFELAGEPIQWEPITDFWETSKDKFIFKVPKTEYYFNENDCWARVKGNYARIGISDFLQQHGGDVTYVELPEIGKEIELFDELTALETMKAVVPVLSTVKGTIQKVNLQLKEKPELLNLNPYEEGWIAELLIAEVEKDLLLDGKAYLEHLKNKLEKEF